MATKQLTIPQKLKNLSADMKDVFMERDDAIDTAVLALITRKTHFQLGPPGSGKTLLVDHLVKRIGDYDLDEYFWWLITAYTQPEELYGGPDMRLFAHGDETRGPGTYERNTHRKLPRAKIAMLDEIFRGSSSILNANLTILNERKFYNGEQDPNIPLMALYAAANNLPTNQDLAAFWDRLEFRVEVDWIQDTANFVHMMQNPPDPNPKKFVTLAEIEEAQELVNEVTIPADIYQSFVILRDQMRKHGIDISDRTWVNCKKTIQGEAFLNGHKEAEPDDIRPLQHMLWEKKGQFITARRSVIYAINPIEADIQDLLDGINTVYKEFQKDLIKADNDKKKEQEAVLFVQKAKVAKTKLKELMGALEESGRTSELPGFVAQRLQEIGKMAYIEGNLKEFVKTTPEAKEEDVLV